MGQGWPYITQWRKLQEKLTASCCAQEEAPNAVEAVTHPEGEAEASNPKLDSEAPTVSLIFIKIWGR